MASITKLEPSQARGRSAGGYGNRTNQAPADIKVYLDGVFVIRLAALVVTEAALRIGQEISRAELEELRTRHLFQKTYDRALYYLAGRPHSSQEVRRHLLSRPECASVLDEVLTKLDEVNLLNDLDFAQFWVENREQFSPRSSRMLQQELRQKGVDRQTASALSRGDDTQRAIEAARKRAQLLSDKDRQTFRTKLGGFLGRRGFSYDSINSAVAHCWAELHPGAPGIEAAEEESTEREADLEEPIGQDKAQGSAWRQNTPGSKKLWSRRTLGAQS